MLLDNPYVFRSFWNYQSGKIDKNTWKNRFASGKRAAKLAVASDNTPALLGVLFNRLYTLRNQLIDGGATWSGSVNREQVLDCTNLLGKLVPLIIESMMDHPGHPVGGCLLSGGGLVLLMAEEKRGLFRFQCRLPRPSWRTWQPSFRVPPLPSCGFQWQRSQRPSRCCHRQTPGLRQFAGLPH